MANRTSKSISEVIGDPESVEDEPDEVAEVELPGGIDAEEFSPRASDYADIASLEHAPTVTAARETAKIPPHYPMKDLEGKTVIFVHKRQQKAALPGTGELRNGYFCLCVFADDKTEFTTWVGQTILYRELTLLQMPFKATITKRGRTYMFA